jgi:hypothetical protein
MQVPKLSTLNQINELSLQIEHLESQLEKLIEKLNSDQKVKEQTVKRHREELESHKLQKKIAEEQKSHVIALQNEELELIPRFSETIVTQTQKYLNSQKFLEDVTNIINKLVLKSKSGSEISLLVDKSWNLEVLKQVSIKEGKKDECVLSIGQTYYIFSKDSLLNEISTKLFNNLLTK